MVEVAEPTSTAYAQCVLLIAQLFQLSGHAGASLQCLLDVYKGMPAPYTLEDGLVIMVSGLPRASVLHMLLPLCLTLFHIQARLYERKGAQALAALSWNTLFARQQQPTIVMQQQQQAARKASAIADFANRSFAQQDFVFALDAHRELFNRYRHYSNGGQLSYAFMHKYLHSALQVRDPAANYKSERTQLAWGLARIASSAWPHDYADPDFHNLRNEYFASFPAIYSAVFAWDDAPARVIAQWWRTYHERQLRRQEAELDQQRQAAAPELSSQNLQSKTRKKRGAAGKNLPPRVPAKTRAPSRLFTETSTSSQSLTAPSNISKKCIASKRTLVASTGGQRSPKRDQAAREESEGADTVQQTNQREEPARHRSPTTRSTLSTTRSSVAQLIGRDISNAKRRGRTSKVHHNDGAFYENSPTKRKLSAVRFALLYYTFGVRLTCPDSDLLLSVLD